MRAAVLLFLATSCAISSGCSTPPDSFPITFVNDTGRNVALNLCADHACRHYDYSDKLRSGGSTGENIATDNVFTRWAVIGPSGRRLGCLSFSFKDAYNHAVARLSQMVACPGNTPLPLTSGTREHD